MTAGSNYSCSFAVLWPPKLPLYKGISQQLTMAFARIVSRQHQLPLSTFPQFNSGAHDSSRCGSSVRREQDTQQRQRQRETQQQQQPLRQMQWSVWLLETQVMGCLCKAGSMLSSTVGTQSDLALYSIRHSTKGVFQPFPAKPVGVAW